LLGRSLVGPLFLKVSALKPLISSCHCEFLLHRGVIVLVT
jgi:hypothetical protein